MRHPDVTAHHLIADLCTALAQEVVEELYSRRNWLYKTNKDRVDLVKQIAPTLKGEAKQILGAMLADEDISQYQKDKIYEALVLDNELPKTGTSVVRKGLY